MNTLAAILLTIALAVNLALPSLSYAQESSASGSLVDKINALKTEIASKAAQLKNEITKKVQNKAIIYDQLNCPWRSCLFL